ncbi:MAG: putative Fe-S cluster assembly protein SufT [Candidatus Marinimicrobia bacterium]|jgi:probable FeS assembly SUF system protein SufT|nr:putative Fe-S cluster assembly protein SufT [Candidatus Neomarinimicrobiota bacterium]MBT3936585.1 putative Fe-S cluster assembly protein SufT [Candidatus Neomarinimicrobiota bacterium]MBT3961742.1 putative Fe-S cluster assembly protein SufT [Candidatus Neomarinimicrobiota bacterium]MBT4382797.1 putative Fe-S cluster assembly protein SufT [Candidatus Neomarinimicrobiota bacterium]MBT4635267.1 putative Fe-S cluster assembly protein SufT [Candidatus Neomarinimicrobiota bacterium]
MTHPTDSIKLTRDVEAHLVPSGESITLLKGELVRITQSLGGNYTVLISGNMAQIRDENADAIGFKSPKEDISKNKNEPFTEGMVWDQMKTCYDPEIPVNVVDLGLIYGCEISEMDEGKLVAIQMTLTAPGCGMGHIIADEVKRKVNGIQGVDDVSVELVWEPQWNRDMMTVEARLELGLY